MGNEGSKPGSRGTSKRRPAPNTQPPAAEDSDEEEESSFSFRPGTEAAASTAPQYGSLAQKAVVGKPELQRFDSADYFSAAHAKPAAAAGASAAAAPPATAAPAVDYGALNQRAGRAALLGRSGIATRPVFCAGRKAPRSRARPAGARS